MATEPKPAHPHSRHIREEFGPLLEQHLLNLIVNTDEIVIAVRINGKWKDYRQAVLDRAGEINERFDADAEKWQ